MVFDAVSSAKAKNADVLIVDTAGRLHNKKHLMEELEKISRVVDREWPQAARETLLVLKDSFFNSMAPFLAQHYDLVVIDLSKGLRGTALCDLIAQYECVGVLIVYNAENMIISNSVATLHYSN